MLKYPQLANKTIWPNQSYKHPKKKKTSIIRTPQLTSSYVSAPTIQVDRKPPNDDKVLAKPNIVPLKLGAISKPFPKYPGVTAPCVNKARVNIVTDQTASLPKNTWANIKRPGVVRAKNYNKIFVYFTFNTRSSVEN